MLRRRVLLFLAALVLRGRAPRRAALELPVAARTLRERAPRARARGPLGARRLVVRLLPLGLAQRARTAQTGIAHLFEHMMFNGGKKFGPGVFDDLIEGNGGSTNGYTTPRLHRLPEQLPARGAAASCSTSRATAWRNLAITPAEPRAGARHRHGGAPAPHRQPGRPA